MTFAASIRLSLGMTARVPSPIVCDVSALPADGVTVDALARLQLEARRLGLAIELRNVPFELVELLDLAGLRDVLRVEARGQAEEREQRVGVEEERELGDPAS
jgi:hypothetical protein